MSIIHQQDGKTPPVLLGSGCDLTGRKVRYWGRVWKIMGKTYLDDSWRVERRYRKDGQWFRSTSSISLFVLPTTHPHYADLLVRTPEK